jgi:hypothetical protein
MRCISLVRLQALLGGLPFPLRQDVSERAFIPLRETLHSDCDVATVSRAEGEAVDFNPPKADGLLCFLVEATG